eukprot:Hpha_TRINITY_DN16713_c0_g1::TRINITY_DN16713_c0_g1_i12::g.79833::m.79833
MTSTRAETRETSGSPGHFSQRKRARGNRTLPPQKRRRSALHGTVLMRTGGSGLSSRKTSKEMGTRERSGSPGRFGQRRRAAGNPTLPRLKISGGVLRGTRISGGESHPTSMTSTRTVTRRRGGSPHRCRQRRRAAGNPTLPLQRRRRSALTGIGTTGGSALIAPMTSTRRETRPRSGSPLRFRQRKRAAGSPTLHPPRKRESALHGTVLMRTGGSGLSSRKTSKETGIRERSGSPHRSNQRRRAVGNPTPPLQRRRKSALLGTVTTRTGGKSLSSWMISTRMVTRRRSGSPRRFRQQRRAAGNPVLPPPRKRRSALHGTRLTGGQSLSSRRTLRRTGTRRR